MGNREPDVRQGVNRVEHAGQKGRGRNDKVGDGGNVIKALGDDPGHQPKHRQAASRQQKFGNQHHGRLHRQMHEWHGHGQHCRGNQDDAHKRRQYVGAEPLKCAQRRHEQKHEVAHQLGLNDRRAGVGKGVLDHRHHDQAG